MSKDWKIERDSYAPCNQHTTINPERLQDRSLSAAHARLTIGYSHCEELQEKLIPQSLIPAEEIL